ncbi:MAG TPA: carboxypeptidase-like regulatory domain-containing protein [Candidatus Thermoplasmatota archaeon]|nr:carboxypeptidase-like regulatory domain-containing protein [Candidatus Thermoplasmatota archaeon]
MEPPALPRRLVPAVASVVALLVLAGCVGVARSDPSADLGAAAQEVEATATTGGIRGIVVDQAIRPIKGITVTATGGGHGEKATTDAGGAFSIGNLPAGTYIVTASHVLYDSAQQSVEVKAGDKAPPLVKMQLTQKVSSKPYLTTLKARGFVTCSVNAVVLLSEECGEGVGVPCEVPVYGCQRVAGQANNRAQFDFSVDGPFVKTLIVEQAWEPTSAAGQAFYSPVSTHWSCLPGCGGKQLFLMEGASPLLGRADNETLDGFELNATTKISVFTWASPRTTPVGVLLNQEFQTFATAFYYLPAPKDWSFVAGSPDPFQ